MVGYNRGEFGPTSMAVDKKSDLLVVTNAKELCSYIMTVTQKSPKQYEQIAKLTTDCQRLLGAWINSDKKRFTS